MHQAVMNHDEITHQGKVTHDKTRNDADKRAGSRGVGDAAPRSGGGGAGPDGGARRRRQPRRRGRARHHHRPAHRPQPQGPLHRRASVRSRFDRLGQRQPAHRRGAARSPLGQGARPCPRPRPLRPGPARRRRSELPPARARDHGDGVAQPVRAQHVPGPASGRAAGLRARLHGRAAALAAGRARAARHPLAGRDRGRSRASHGADLRHPLCRRDQEVDLFRAELSVARAGRAADALLGQCRAGWRRGDLLRAVGHRQDDAVGRSRPAADRRRRARLGSARRLQLRGRLLCQGDPAVGRARARDFRGLDPVRRDPRERGRRPAERRGRSRRRQPDREHAGLVSAALHPERERDRDRRPSAPHRHADRRCVRRAAADQQALARAGDVSLPVGLHGAGRRHGGGRQGAAGDLLGLFRRAVPAAQARASTPRCWAS